MWVFSNPLNMFGGANKNMYMTDCGSQGGNHFFISPQTQKKEVLFQLWYKSSLTPESSCPEGEWTQGQEPWDESVPCEVPPSTLGAFMGQPHAGGFPAKGCDNRGCSCRLSGQDGSYRAAVGCVTIPVAPGSCCWVIQIISPECMAELADLITGINMTCREGEGGRSRGEQRM